MDERVRDRASDVPAGADGRASRARTRAVRRQSAWSLALVVLAVAALMAGLSWRTGLLSPGDDSTETSSLLADGSPTPGDSPSAVASDPEASPTGTPAASPAETPTETPSASPVETPTATPTELSSPSPTPTASPRPVWTPAPGLTPGPAPAGRIVPSATMSCERHRSIAVKLADGRVLVASGCVGDAEGTDGKGHWIYGLADVFDPNTARFTQTGTMTSGRDLGSQALLPDGRVLFVGGSEAFPGDATATEIYDPSIGRFVPGPHTPRALGQPATFLLKDGRILVVAGDTTDQSTPDTAGILDPWSGTYTAAGGLAYSGKYGAIAGTLLSDGRVFFVAQVFHGAQSVTYGQVYDPATNKFTPTGAFTEPLDGWECLTPQRDGKVAVVGGNLDGPVQIYDPAGDAFQRAASMPKPLNVSSCVALAGGKILVLGTPISKGQVAPTGWSGAAGSGLFDPRPPALRPSTAPDAMTGPDTITAELGTTAKPRAAYAFNAVALDDGRALIVGGSSNTGEIFDPNTNRFALIK